MMKKGLDTIIRWDTILEPFLPFLSVSPLVLNERVPTQRTFREVKAMAKAAALAAHIFCPSAAPQTRFSPQNDWYWSMWRLLWSDLRPICDESGQFAVARRLPFLLRVSCTTKSFLLLQRRPATLSKWLWETIWRQVWTMCTMFTSTRPCHAN